MRLQEDEEGEEEEDEDEDEEAERGQEASVRQVRYFPGPPPKKRINKDLQENIGKHRKIQNNVIRYYCLLSFFIVFF